MTTQEDDATLLQRGDVIAVRPEHAFGILALREICRRPLGRRQRVGLELAAGKRSQVVLVPHRLVEQREVSRAVRGGDGKKIPVSKGEDLRVDRIAHQVEPRTRDIGVVPHLLARALVGDGLLERFVIPEIRTLENHRHGFEVASARSAAQPFRQLSKLPGARRDDLIGRGGARATSGNSSGADCQRSQAEKSAAPRVIDSHSFLLRLRVAANEWSIRTRLLGCQVVTR